MTDNVSTAIFFHLISMLGFFKRLPTLSVVAPFAVTHFAIVTVAGGGNGRMMCDNRITGYEIYDIALFFTTIAYENMSIFTENLTKMKII